jgi:hypothetical protein
VAPLEYLNCPLSFGGLSLRPKVHNLNLNVKAEEATIKQEDKIDDDDGRVIIPQS